ncbi:trigger factor [Solidesulfovibrio sp.]
MEYTVTQITPVKTKINVSVPAEEATAALSSAVALFRSKADIKGFRKGKVPASVVEQRFKKEIVGEATTDLINVHINDIMGELKLSPLSGLDVSEAALAKGEPLEYTFTFEHAPTFELPDYKGQPIEEEEVVVSDADIDAVIERVRKNLAEVAPISGNRQPVDGDVVSVTFEAFENGAPIPGVRAENFEMTLGEGQALPDFEALVKSIPAGGEGEGEIAFPGDFINADLAGRTVTMKVAVHVIKERTLPPVDDELAKKAGNFDNLDKMREAITMSYKKSREDLHRSSAQKKLLDKLLASLDFPLPPSAVEQQLGQMVQEFVTQLERRGKSLEASGKSLADVEVEMTPRAEELVKTQIFLGAVAAKEDLSVTPQEMDAFFYRLSTQVNQDVVLLKRYYEDNGMMIMVRDKLLADKAADLIYASALVTKVAPSEPAAEAEVTA